MKDEDAPEWLPDLFDFNWNRYDESLDGAYAVFERDFREPSTRPKFRGKRLGLKRHPEDDGKCATFWHFVTEGEVESARSVVRERIERIAWPKSMLFEAASATPRVLVWSNERRRSTHTKSVRWVIALPDFSYVVIVDERDDFALPWTAYCVSQPHRRAKLAEEYRRWLAAQKS